MEERLIPFSGAVLVVSHDREFLDNVVTSTIAFEPEGLREYVGGYSDWRRQVESRSSPSTAVPTKASARPKASQSAPESQPAKRKLKYREQQELAALPSKIEALEGEIAEMHDAMAAPEFYQQDGTRIAEAQQALKTAEDQLAQAYQRWEELESAES